MKLKNVLIICALTVFVCALLIGGSYLLDNKMSNFKADMELFVQEQDTAQDVLEKLSRSKNVRSISRLGKVFSSKQVARYLKAGNYSIKKSYSSVYVARMLNNGWQSPVKLVLSGNLRTPNDIAYKISSQLKVDYNTVKDAITSDKVMAKYGLDGKTFYALFIPDTYEIYWDASMDQILRIMKKNVDAFWTADRLAKAKQLGLSRMDATILASIVNCESNYAPEYPQIAGSYINRLRKHMRLQACPTVAYVYGFTLNRVLYEHLKVDSPYNTYTHAGLPPGPICSPTRAALDGVLNADVGSGYLFFCASPSFDGTHRFASTYKEHSANAKAFQDELDRRKKDNS